jgi:hypothetical protein
MTFLPGQQPLSGTTAFIWHNSLYLAQRPLSGTTAFIWHNGLSLAQQPLPVATASTLPTPFT